MKKLTYIQPSITVVKFTVEQGFNASQRVGLIPNRGDSFLERSYSTGESITETTGSDGEFFSGRWN